MTFFKNVYYMRNCSCLLFIFDMLLPFSHHITAQTALLKLTLYTVIMTLTKVVGAPTGGSKSNNFGCDKISVTDIF